MASKTSPADPPPLDMLELGRRLARRRAELASAEPASVEVPRNSGTRRTARKQALLKAIRDAGGRW